MGGPQHDNKLLTHIRSLPLPSYLESFSPSDYIAGNISDEDKIANAKTLAYFTGSYMGSSKEGNEREHMCFGRAIGERLRLVRIDVRKRVNGQLAEGCQDAETLEAVGQCEITVDEDMTNPYGGLHGACAAYLVDICSSVPLVAIAIASDTDLFGLSQTMHLTWHSPARRGTRLRIIGSSVAVNGRTLTGRCEVRASQIADAIETEWVIVAVG